MSDSLVLTGVKDIKKHTGTEMVRLTPAGGGDVFRVKQWWSQSSGNAIYVDVTMFSVTNSSGTVKLAVESNMSTNLRIDVDGNFAFSFYNFNQVQRAALYTSDLALIEQYVFPSISAGKTMVVTYPGAPSRPSPVDEVLSGVTLTGPTSVGSSTTETYTASKTGTATDVVYTLTSNAPADSIDGLDVTYGAATGARVLTLSGSSVEAGKTVANTLAITVV
tara:strand:- start:300 stop:959 length:660 start_codon:yes stop_codon:yes gene_type:complete